MKTKRKPKWRRITLRALKLQEHINRLLNKPDPGDERAKGIAAAEEDYRAMREARFTAQDFGQMVDFSDHYIGGYIHAYRREERGRHA